MSLDEPKGRRREQSASANETPEWINTTPVAITGVTLLTAALLACCACCGGVAVHNHSPEKKKPADLRRAPAANKAEEKKIEEEVKEFAAMNPERIQAMLKAIKDAAALGNKRANARPHSPHEGFQDNEVFRNDYAEYMGLLLQYQRDLEDCLKQGKFVKAQEFAEVFVAYRGEEPQKYIWRGDALAGQKKTDEARHAYQKALQILEEREKTRMNYVKSSPESEIYQGMLRKVRGELLPVRAKIEALKK